MVSVHEPVAEPLRPEDATGTPWSEVRGALAEGQWYWLATVGPNGRPHVVPVLTVWLDGALYTTSAAGARKARNLALDSHCVVTVDNEAMHLVVEGEATKVRDETKLERVAGVYRSKYEWPATVRDGAFDAPYGAPTAGPPPYEVYEITPTVAFGFGTDEKFIPTRWRF
ncbi:MAG: pyridoxamine 5'-phosphate oxidase family protein [Acidimicrobiia bacterium]